MHTFGSSALRGGCFGEFVGALSLLTSLGSQNGAWPLVLGSLLPEQPVSLSAFKEASALSNLILLCKST